MSGIIAMHKRPTLVPHNQHPLPFFLLLSYKIKERGLVGSVTNQR